MSILGLAIGSQEFWLPGGIMLSPANLDRLFPLIDCQLPIDVPYPLHGAISFLFSYLHPYYSKCRGTTACTIGLFIIFPSNQVVTFRCSGVSEDRVWNISTRKKLK